jgi:hypothetical protein
MPFAINILTTCTHYFEIYCNKIMFHKSRNLKKPIKQFIFYIQQGGYIEFTAPLMYIV